MLPLATAALKKPGLDTEKHLSLTVGAMGVTMLQEAQQLIMYNNALCCSVQSEWRCQNHVLLHDHQYAKLPPLALIEVTKPYSFA